MPFTGKTTYGAGASLPELAEDVSDIIGIVSPHETPLLDHFGDPRAEAQSTIHEWLEDLLLPNTPPLPSTTFSPTPLTATTFTVDDGSKFRDGDQIQVEGSGEVMLVLAIAADDLIVTRGYGGTSAENLADNQKILILGNAALAEVPAIKDGRVYMVNSKLFTTLSFWNILGVEEMARLLWPEDVVDEESVPFSFPQ